MPTQKESGLRSERGVTIVEYVMMLGLVCLAALTGVASTGTASAASFDTAAGALACSNVPSFGEWHCVRCDESYCYFGLDGGGTWGTDPGPLGNDGLIRARR